MLRPLAPVAQPLIVTTAPGARAAPPEHIAQAARAEGTGDVLVCPDDRRRAGQGLGTARHVSPRPGRSTSRAAVLALLGHDPVSG